MIDNAYTRECLYVQSKIWKWPELAKHRLESVSHATHAINASDTRVPTQYSYVLLGLAPARSARDCIPGNILTTCDFFSLQLN